MLSGCPPLSPTVGPGAVLGAAAPAPANSSPAAGPAWALPLQRSGDYSSSYYLLFPLLLLLPSSSSSGPPPRLQPVPAPAAAAAALWTRRRPLLPGRGAQVGFGHPTALLPRSAALQGRQGQGKALAGIGKGESRVVLEWWDRRAQRAGMLVWDAPASSCSQHHSAPSIILLPASSCSLHPGVASSPCSTASSGRSSGVVVPSKILTRFLRVVWSDLALCWVCSVPVNSDGSSGG